MVTNVNGLVRGLIKRAARGEAGEEEMYALADAKTLECVGIDAEELEDILSLAYFGGIGDLDAHDTRDKGPLTKAVGDDSELKSELREALANMNEVRKGGGGFMAQIVPIMRPGAVTNTCRTLVFALVCRTLIDKTDPYSGMPPIDDEDEDDDDIDNGDSAIDESAVDVADATEDAAAAAAEVQNGGDGETGATPGEEEDPSACRGAIARITGIVPALIAWLKQPTSSTGLRSAGTKTTEALVKVWAVAGDALEDSMDALYPGSLNASAVRATGEMDGNATVAATKVSGMLLAGKTPEGIMDMLESDGIAKYIRAVERRWSAATSNKSPRTSLLSAFREGLGARVWRHGGGGSGSRDKSAAGKAACPMVVAISSIAITAIVSLLP